MSAYTPPPEGWAIYVREPAGPPLLRDVERLADVIGRRAGRVAGIYADVGDPDIDDGELSMLLGHARLNRFSSVAIVDARALGLRPRTAALAMVFLIDLGVHLYSLEYAGKLHPDGRMLSLDDVGAELIGPDYEGGAMLGLLDSRVGLAHSPRR